MSLPRVVVLTTGGTIASMKDPSTGAVRSAASPEDLMRLVPDLVSIADVSAIPMASINSWNITPAMMAELVSRAVTELRHEGVAGVVVTHGTDTVEETAVLAWMLNPTEKPIVFVAAMRNLSETSPDGPRNLRDAIRVAASATAAGRGALLLVNETLHDARYVTKTHTVNPSTFVSPHGGPIGEVTAVGVELFRPASARPVLPAIRTAGRVPVVKVYTGMDGSILDWYRETGVDGVVIEGTGAGNVPGSLLPGIDALISAGKPVVLTTRCLGGPLAPIYGTGGASGGGHDLMAMGVIPASRFTSQKARIALVALLGNEHPVDEIADWFRSA